MSDFKTFMSITEDAIASEIISILKKNNIQFKVEDTRKNFDASFSLSEVNKPILIFLNPLDFEKANKIIDQEMIIDEENINKGHFLYSFTDEELLELVKNPNEWHPFDVKLAKKILNKKNISVNEEDILINLKKKELENNQPEKSDLITILLGYVFSLIGGLFGIGIAIFLITNKKTLTSGKKIYTYTKSDRDHGYKMLILSIIMLILYFYVYLKE